MKPTTPPPNKDTKYDVIPDWWFSLCPENIHPDCCYYLLSENVQPSYGDYYYEDGWGEEIPLAWLTRVQFLQKLWSINRSEKTVDQLDFKKDWERLEKIRYWHICERLPENIEKTLIKKSRISKSAYVFKSDSVKRARRFDDPYFQQVTEESFQIIADIAKSEVIEYVGFNGICDYKLLVWFANQQKYKVAYFDVQGRYTDNGYRFDPNMNLFFSGPPRSFNDLNNTLIKGHHDIDDMIIFDLPTWQDAVDDVLTKHKTPPTYMILVGAGRRMERHYFFEWDERENLNLSIGKLKDEYVNTLSDDELER